MFTALLGVALLPPIWLFDPDVLKPSATAIAAMSGCGVLYMGAILFYLRAIQSEEASVVAPLFQANTLFAFLLGYLFLHEVLGLMQLGGGALVLVGALGLSKETGLKFRGIKKR